MSKYSKFLLMSFFLMLLPSCSKVNVRTNAIADHNYLPSGFVLGSSFLIVSLNQNEQMISKEILRKITNILENKSYVVAEDANADYLFTFNFDMNSSDHTKYIPIYTPGEVKVKNGNILSRGSASSNYTQRMGFETVHGNICSNAFGSSQYTEVTRSSGTIQYIPRNYKLFHLILHIQVYDLRAYKTVAQEKKEACSLMSQFWNWMIGFDVAAIEDILPRAQVWQANSVISHESADLRRGIDYLLLAAFEHFGKDTYGETTNTIDLKDKEKLSLLCKRSFL